MYVTLVEGTCTAYSELQYTRHVLLRATKD